MFLLEIINLIKMVPEAKGASSGAQHTFLPNSSTELFRINELSVLQLLPAQEAGGVAFISYNVKK